MTKEELKRQVTMVVEVSRAIIDTVHETYVVDQSGSPETMIYLALQSKFGLSLQTYQELIELCLKSGKIKRGPMHTLLPA